MADYSGTMHGDCPAVEPPERHRVLAYYSPLIGLLPALPASIPAGRATL